MLYYQVMTAAKDVTMMMIMMTVESVKELNEKLAKKTA